MAKTGTIATISPTASFGMAQAILEEDVQAVIEQQNWSAGQIPIVHRSGPIGEDFRATGSAHQVREGMLYIHPETVTIQCGAECTMAAGETATITITINAQVATINTFTNAKNGTEQSSTLATSATGTGWQDWQIAIELTSGSAGNSTCDRARIQDAVVAATALSDPSND